MKKSKKTVSHTDPFQHREAEKYSRPIASREYIMEILLHIGTPLRMNQIAECLKLSEESDLEALRRRLRAMERDAQLVRNRKGEYGLAKKMDLVCGRVIGHPDGYGFLVPEDSSPDVFMTEKQMRCLIHGDRVLVSIGGIDHRGRREGIVTEILERNTQEVVGRYIQQSKHVGCVQPHNRRINHSILIPKEEQRGVADGQIVVVRLLEQPTSHQPPIGQIIEILGEQHAPGMEIDIAIRAHNLPQTWSPELLKEIAHLKPTVPTKAFKHRVDLRTVPLVTIDGEDSRDFDDAVYCEPRGKGWKLLVAIADVSSYVKPDTELDREAQKRGTSVYFPNRVIPMLPEILSNGLCSLNPHVERLCMVAELWIDMYGRTRRADFYEAVMRSAARLTYTQVARVIEGHPDEFPHPELLPHIENLNQLYQRLAKRRRKRGAIDFETTETRIQFDAQQKIEKIVPVVRNDAHRLIEEMMLAANVAAAEWLEKWELPFLYRVHEGATPEKLTELRRFLSELGLDLGGGDEPTALHYAKLIDQIKTRPDARLIQTVLLRSMRMAFYSPDNQGHFGLAYPAYTHFTSPIRRYPDLMVHRAIRHRLKEMSLHKYPYAEPSVLQHLGEQCSTTERRADEATRDAIGWLKCEYIQNKVGEVYEGTISAVTSFGLFVELDGIFVEGLIHVTALQNDYYHFDPAHHRLRGERTGKTYRLFDRLKVRVVRVNLEEKK
ncbi:MAG: ribonuclease, partial [Bacteroidota bacterium]